jgi:hypothetical protein
VLVEQGASLLLNRPNPQQREWCKRRGVHGAVVGHDQRHDHVQGRKRAIRKGVETVARSQGPVRVLGLRSFESKKSGFLTAMIPRSTSHAA